MQAELKAQCEQLSTMSHKQKQILLSAFVLWENTVIDHVSLGALECEISEKRDRWEIDESDNIPYKTSPQEAMCQIELILQTTREATGDVGEGTPPVSDALDKIRDIAFFAGRAYKKVKLSTEWIKKNENEVFIHPTTKKVFIHSTTNTHQLTNFLFLFVWWIASSAKL